MKWPELNSRNLVAVILACTISAFILIVAFGIVFAGAQTTAENSKVREAVVLLVVNLSGVLSGWLLGRVANDKLPEEKPPEPPK